jgi:hypothetical protein
MSKRTEELERENEILRAQVKVLTAQQQNQRQPQMQQIPLPNQPAPSTDTQSSRPTSDSIAATLLNVLQGNNSAGGLGIQQSVPQNSPQANALAQLFPALLGATAAVPSAQASSNPLDNLSQVLKNLQGQQQQQRNQQQQSHQHQQRQLQQLQQQQAQQQQHQQDQQQQDQQERQSNDLQGMLNFLTGGNSPAPAPSSGLAAGLAAGLAGLVTGGQSSLNENTIKEFLAQQQQQQRPAQDHRAALLRSLTGQGVQGSKNSALANILANADPVAQQNVLASMLQSSQNQGHPGQNPFVSNSNNSTEHAQVESSQSRDPTTAGQSGNSQSSHSSQAGSQSNPSMQGEQMAGQREALNQILPTLSPGTIYNILKQQPASRSE